MESKPSKDRIYLSPPDLTGTEGKMLQEILASNWIAPFGPHLEQFEQLICQYTGYKYAVALNSATSALHLALLSHNVGVNDVVICSTLTFCAAPNSILYTGAKPVFIDSEVGSWNIDVNLLEQYLKQCKSIPKAIIVTHIYGMPADIQSIEALAEQYGFAIIHDLAESIGAKYQGKKLGKFSGCGIYSFNGNKLITTGGGGAFATNDKSQAEQILYLSTQAKSKGMSYHHEAVGYNYRMSNVLAGIGIAQFSELEHKIDKKRQIFDRYYEAFSGYSFIAFQEEKENYFSDRWLTCLLVNQGNSNLKVVEIIAALEKENIESRPTWKPMHLQPIYQQYEFIGGMVSENIYNNGICLASGTSLSEDDQDRIITILKAIFDL